MPVENVPAAAGKRPAELQAGGGSKRRRSGGAEGAFDEMLCQAGCELSSSRDGITYKVEDPRKLRRLLEQKLTLQAELRDGFMAGLHQQLAEDDALHAALKPMQVTGNAPDAGNSFVRVLLNVAPLQAQLSQLLLEKLAALSDGGEEDGPLPRLILGQFRWLDHIVDPRGLTATLLEVLAGCTGVVQKEVVTFLPEVATEEDHEAVIEALRGLMGEDGGAFILPSIEALANLCLTPTQQSDVVDAVMQHFQSAKAEDLPGVARFLLQYAAPGKEMKEVIKKLREELHFVTPSDPRLAVPDRKQKGQVGGGREDLEQKLLEALKHALQLNPGAADAALREIRGAADPASQRILDLWLLLVMLTIGADRRKAAENALRRKFAEGHAHAVWLNKGITGHETAMLEFFPQLLSLAQQLLRASAASVQQTGVELFCCLFTRFTDSYNQQEVLRALHSHLGAQVAGETSAALQVLLQLSQQHTACLGRYSAFLTNMLDYVDHYPDQQVHQVFGVFSELVAGACRQADGGAGGSDMGGRSRMEDELMIFVRKQLSSAQGGHRSVGIIGTVALVQRLGAAVSDGQETESAIGKRYREAMQTLKDTFDSCRRSPEAFAFLCDELTRGIVRGAIGSRLMRDVHAILSTHLEDTFCCFLEGSQLAPVDAAVQLGGQRLESELWWNLDGSQSPVALRLLPLLAEELAPGSNSAPLLSLFSSLRLMSALELQLHHSLESVAALLGCPFNLFSRSLASPQHFGALAADQQGCVLLGLWYTLNWCRELVNCFGRQLKPDGVGDESTQLKLFGRLRCCCQLEALMDALMQYAPPLFVLPPLANTLDSSPGTLAAAAAAAAPAKKAAAKGGGKGSGKGGSKKKAVKFEDNNSSGGSGPGGGAATSQHTTSGTGGGSMAQTASGGSAATQAGAAATQGVAVAAVAGLGWLAKERWKRRSLLLPALATLGVGAMPGQEHACYAMLPTGAYLLADLHSKLKTALACSRPSAFGSKASKQQQPADLAELDACQLLQAVCPLLPALRRHMEAACDIIDQGLAEADTEQHDRTNFWEVVAAAGASQLTGSAGGMRLEETAAACMVPMDIPCATAALSPIAAAPRVRTLALDCLLQLVQWPGLAQPANRHVLHAFLAAFQKKPVEAPIGVVVEAEQGPVSDAELLKLVKGCFIHLSSPLQELESDQPTTESPSHQHACLLILEGLTRVMGAVVAEPSEDSVKLGRQMSKRISKAAEAVLRRVSVDTEGKELGSSVWKGRGSILADVLRLYLRHYSARVTDGNGSGGGACSSAVHLVLELAADYLPAVSESNKAKEAAVYVEPYPSLCGATISTWYRVCAEQLQECWEGVAAAAVGAEKHRAMLEDDEALYPILAGMQSCAAAFTALLAVVKRQTQRVAIHVQAVRSGGKFLLTFFKTLPFWAHIFSQHQAAFQSVVKDIQKGTRVLHTLCSEGKYRKAMPLTARVPVVKRTVERFVFLIKAFLTEVSAGGAFQLGTLKHKDLSGREVPSQMYTEEDAEEEEGEGSEGEDEDEGSYEEEQMGETQQGED